MFTLEQQARFFGKVSFEPMSGCLLWTGARTVRGYGHLTVDSRHWTAYRFSWVHVHGALPDEVEIDHICHNPSCVNPDHLRIATHAENMRNSVRQKNNQCGLKGVSWRHDRRKWRAVITANHAYRHLGYFTTAEAAHRAYCLAARELHGNFANFGGQK